MTIATNHRLKYSVLLLNTFGSFYFPYLLRYGRKLFSEWWEKNVITEVH